MLLRNRAFAASQPAPDRFSQMANVDARHNWWGSPTGPLDNSDDRAAGGFYNPTGQGDPVTDHVDFGGWNTVPAKEWAGAARKDVHFLSLVATSKEEMLHGLARTRSPAPWYIQVGEQAPRLLADWVKEVHP